MILTRLQSSHRSGSKALAILIDPDKTDDKLCSRVIDICAEEEVDYLMVGGSLITNTNQSHIIRKIKNSSSLPVILFPGSNMYLDSAADAVLFLSLISGRNPDFLIGQHVVAAPFLRAEKMETLPTGYLLVGDDRNTTVAYISNTQPIPSKKYEIAASTAMAGEMLGLKLIYLDAGSGSAYPVPPEMIREVRRVIDVPLIVGGGINSEKKAHEAFLSGADLIVVGNGIEKDNAELIREIARLTKTLNQELDIHK